MFKFIKRSSLVIIPASILTAYQSSKIYVPENLEERYTLKTLLLFGKTFFSLVRLNYSFFFLLYNTKSFNFKKSEILAKFNIGTEISNLRKIDHLQPKKNIDGIKV
jgi:hypothetical protein